MNGKGGSVRSEAFIQILDPPIGRFLFAGKIYMNKEDKKIICEFSKNLFSDKKLKEKYESLSLNAKKLVVGIMDEITDYTLKFGFEKGKDFFSDAFLIMDSIIKKTKEYKMIKEFIEEIGMHFFKSIAINNN